MTKFKAKPALLQALPNLPDPDDVARFAAGAVTRNLEPNDATSPELRQMPWETLDKAGKPISGLNLRLNAYEHELLKFLAQSEQRSIQQTIKRLLIPAAEAAAGSIRGGAAERP